DRVAIRVGRSGLHRRRVVQVLPERRQLVAVILPVVGREVGAALVVADTTVVLARDDVVRVGRVVDLLLLGLTPVGAVLVHPLVAVARAVSAAERMSRAASARALTARARVAVDDDVARG